MAINVRTKRKVILATAVITCLILGALLFVFIFMDLVFEPERVLALEEVPAPVLATFDARFPGATDVEWKLSDSVYEAAWPWEGHEEFEAKIAANGTLLRTEFPITFAELPDKAQAYLTSRKKYKVADVERVHSYVSPVAYEVELGNWLKAWDCLFDAEGNLLSEERDDSPVEERVNEGERE